MSNIDLHIHSTYSDGEYDVSQIFHFAYKNNLKAISITDHDMIIDEEILKFNSKKYNVSFIPGIEISTYYNNSEIHILGYGFDSTNKNLNNLVNKISKSRKQRAQQILKNLNSKYNFDLHIDELQSNHNYYGRPQIANLLVKRKICKSFKQAFIEYIGNDNNIVTPKYKVQYENVIKAIKSAGGITSLAHFGRYKNWDMLDSLIKSGLDALEIFHPSHKKTFSDKLSKFCDSNKLLITGGSDFHSKIDKHSFVGNQNVDIKYFQQILEAIKK